MTVTAFRFADVFQGAQPVDRVRNQQMPKVGPTLDYVGERLPSQIAS